RMAAGAALGEDAPAELDGAVEELLVECDLQVPAARQVAGDPQVGGPRRHEEGLHVVEPVLDRPEARAVSPTLTDVEGGLPVMATAGIAGAEVGDMVQPALLGAAADVEVDALNRLVDAD